MGDLTELQSNFVVHFVANGGNATRAAISAGYAEEHAPQAAYKLGKIPHVQAAIVEQQRRELNTLASMALTRLREILSIPAGPVSPVKPSTYVDAAKMIFDRSGLGPKSGGEIASDSKPASELTLAELDDAVRRISAALPVVGSSEPVIEASIDGAAPEDSSKGDK